MSNCKTIAVCNQKGGVGKTTTTVNLGVGLAMQGKKVLLIDADPQGDLTTCLGWRDSDSLSVTLTEKLQAIISEQEQNPFDGILHHKEKVDLVPSNLSLSSLEMTLVTAMSRESVLKNYLSLVKDKYDYVLIDCMPSLGMIAADNPHIKEKMDLDIQVQKLRLLKSNYLSEKYELEDKIIKYYPTTIARTKETIAGLEKDILLAKEHPKPLDDTFVGIEVKGVSYSEKAEGGQKIIDACKEMTSPDPVPLGKYRGFDLELSFDTFEKAYQVKIKGSLSRSVSLGTDATGNITRIDNAIEKISERLEAKSRELSTLEQQFATAKAEVEKPFDKEEELTEKTNRLNVLNGLLNVDKRENELVDGAPDEGDSVPTPKERAYER